MEAIPTAMTLMTKFIPDEFYFIKIKMMCHDGLCPSPKNVPQDGRVLFY